MRPYDMNLRRFLEDHEWTEIMRKTSSYDSPLGPPGPSGIRGPPGPVSSFDDYLFLDKIKAPPADDREPGKPTGSKGEPDDMLASERSSPAGTSVEEEEPNKSPANHNEDSFLASKPEPDSSSIPSAEPAQPQLTRLPIEIQSGMSPVDQKDTCVLCQDFKADVLFVDCRHLITCTKCCNDMATWEFAAQRPVRCPKCMSQVTQTVTMKPHSFNH